jgi:hypothetical protein
MRVTLNMSEMSSTSQGDEIVCSEEDYGRICEKHSKILFIPTKEERKGFTKKFLNEAPNDVKIYELPTIGACKIISKLDLDTSSAVLVEEGKVRQRIPLKDDEVRDTAALMKALLEKPSEIGSCEGEFTADSKGWGIKIKSSSSCQTQLSNLSKLPFHVQKYVTKHMETNEK